MPVGSWNRVYPSSVANSNYISQSGISSLAYTGNAVYGVSHNVGGVNNTTTVKATDWNNFVSKISTERVRRGRSSISYTLTNPITATQFNNLRSYIQVSAQFQNTPSGATWLTTDSAYNSTGQGENNGTGVATYPPATSTYNAPAAPSAATAVSAGGLIYATNVNNLINDINNAGAACVCNCNYCSCNCNYCVCNCNYTCTCNCNYSDERLKENIKLLGKEGDLNVYSYTYIWNSAKTFIGVMAQELLGTKYENALIKTNDGYYAVDYSKLPVQFREA